jgi:hypothetical protein
LYFVVSFVSAEFFDFRPRFLHPHPIPIPRSLVGFGVRDLFIPSSFGYGLGASVPTPEESFD